MKGKRSIIAKWRDRAIVLKRQTYALYLACKDPRVPWYAKALGALVIAYAFSPVDLIPDFIPVLGYLDDLILLPLGIAVIVKMIPKEVMRECLAAAQSRISNEKRRNWVAGTAVIVIWMVVCAAVAVTVLRKVIEVVQQR